MNTAYISPQEESESSVASKRRIYNTMSTLLNTTTDIPECASSACGPILSGQEYSKNVHEAPISATVKATSHKAIHDIILMHDSLHKIRLIPTDICGYYIENDTLTRCLTVCGEGQQMWECIRRSIAQNLRTDWRRIPSDWLHRPSFKLWPPPPHRAILWLLANFVSFRLQTRRTLTHVEYYDFLRRARWKINMRNRGNLVGS
jgi:hypothetical protein